MCGIIEDVHVCHLHIITYVRDSLDDDTPMYFIMKFLTAKGWKPRTASLQHTAESELKFGALLMNQCVAKRAYLQYLETIDTLRDHDLEALPSGQQQGYYKSVLASKFPATIRLCCRRNMRTRIVFRPRTIWIRKMLKRRLRRRMPNAMGSPRHAAAEAAAAEAAAAAAAAQQQQQQKQQQHQQKKRMILSLSLMATGNPWAFRME